MLSVNIADLKNNLSQYLKQVQAGREIVIRDRNRAVAHLLPINGHQSADEELLELAAQGKARLGAGAGSEAYWQMTLPRLRTEARPDLLQWLIDQERNED